MREPNSPMTAAEFDEAVELAKQGAVRSCSGATDAIQEALDAIIDADPLEQSERIREAYSVYQEYCNEVGVNEND